MDEKRFDQIAKTLGSQKTRRATLKGLGLGLLGAAGMATGLEVEAKGKGKRQRTSAQVATTCVNPSACVAGNPDHACCQGYNCQNGVCQCNLGSCQSNADCTCAHVTTCGTSGDTAGQCCRTEIGFYCDTTNVGNNCCGPAYVCATPGQWPGDGGFFNPLSSGGCQCNTAEGFALTNGVCCIPTGSTGNANHPDLCCSGCVVGGLCADASHCQQPQCVAAGQTCNACHQCCDGSTCTDPTHACDGSGGTCCLNNGQPGNSNHPDLCCSGCICPDGNCCDASHCQQPQCTGTGQGSCGANQLCCNNTCVANDATNCGTCGNQCSTDQTCVNGHCQTTPPQCNAPLIPCGSQCINPDTQCCAEEALGVLCPADPRGQRKCCPAGHTCKPNKNGTFNCGKGNGARSRHGGSRKTA